MILLILRLSHKPKCCKCYETIEIVYCVSINVASVWQTNSDHIMNMNMKKMPMQMQNIHTILQQYKSTNVQNNKDELSFY